jgi:hypothetical protein
MRNSKNKSWKVFILLPVLSGMFAGCGGGGEGGGDGDNTGDGENTTSTTYRGTATMDVWYRGLGLPTQRRRYQQNVLINRLAPLHAEANIEQNPFYYKAVTLEAAGQPGFLSIYSASLYIPDFGPTVVWQYWWYSQNEGSYQGTYNPELSNRDNFNIIVAEDATGRGTLFCNVGIAPGATINITFEGNRMTTKVAGGVYDAFIQQLCSSYIERFEISIDAEAVMGN